MSQLGFGLNKENPTKPALNYIGVALVLVSTVFYLMVKKAEEPSTDAQESETFPSDYETEFDTKTINSSQVQQEHTDDSLFGRMSTTQKRIVGISLSVLSGLLYGQAFTPVVYVVDNYEVASKNNMDHLFAFYTGIMVTSLVYFILYCIIKKNKPILYNQLVLPGLTSGKNSSLKYDSEIDNQN